MKRIPLLLGFVAMTAIGVGMTFTVYRAEEAAIQARFDVVANEAVDRIDERLRQHVSLLIATQSFLQARAGGVSRPEFRAFVEGLDLNRRYEGIRGIGFARLLARGDEASAEADLQRHYGLERAIWPETEEDLRAAIVLLEPDDARNHRALGYDMFSEERRRAAMRASIVSGTLRATAPVELVQEITDRKQAGFLVYLPFRGRTPGTDGTPVAPEAARGVNGFVYAPFRAGDLHAAALSRPPRPQVSLETWDITDGEPALLFRSPGFAQTRAESLLRVERVVDFAGRRWSVVMHETAGFRAKMNHFYAFGVGTVAALLVLALTAWLQAQFRALAAARALHAVSEKAAQEKDLMLQEMKHRIKNSLARVMAIARRTAAGSSDVDAFVASFMARLNAMANAQDMLTRSHWQRADLGDLLSSELQQVFGGDLENCTIEGPPMMVDERTTQALSLTFHEMATNALKYGQVAEDGGGLAVTWRVESRGPERWLVLDWRERAAVDVAPPTRLGFGVKLIDANIRGELGGSIERDFLPGGLAIRLAVPLDAAEPQRRRLGLGRTAGG